MRKGVAYFTICVMFIVSLFYDRDLMYLIDSIRNPALSSMFHYLTYIGEAVVGICIIISLLLWKKRRKWVFPLWLSLGISAAISYALKYIIMRPRPYDAGLPYVIKSVAPSFPSAHSAVVFAVMPFLYILYPKQRWIWVFAAFMVMFSRVYLGVHYVSDVLAGASIGFVSAVFIINSMESKWLKKYDPLLKKKRRKNAKSRNI